MKKKVRQNNSSNLKNRGDVLINISGGLAGVSLERKLRKGHRISIPSLGKILTRETERQNSRNYHKKSE